MSPTNDCCRTIFSRRGSLLFQPYHSLVIYLGENTSGSVDLIDLIDYLNNRLGHYISRVPRERKKWRSRLRAAAAAAIKSAAKILRRNPRYAIELSLVRGRYARIEYASTHSPVLRRSRFLLAQRCVILSVALCIIQRFEARIGPHVSALFFIPLILPNAPATVISRLYASLSIFTERAGYRASRLSLIYLSFFLCTIVSCRAFSSGRLSERGLSLSLPSNSRPIFRPSSVVYIAKRISRTRESRASLHRTCRCDRVCSACRGWRVVMPRFLSY